MNIIFSDDSSRLTDEIRALMRLAGNKALALELFPDDEEAAASAASAQLEVSVTVVDGDEIRELNREYRGIDSCTDVLSFPQFNSSDEITAALETVGNVLLGDVVLCYDRAVTQAEEYQTGLTRELVYLFVHSILHLLGYDHMNDEDKRAMRSFEEEVMTSAGVGR